MIDGDEIPVIMEMDDGRQFSQPVISETGTDPKVTALVYRRMGTRCGGRMSSLYPENSPPCRRGWVPRNMMASPDFPNQRQSGQVGRSPLLRSTSWPAWHHAP